MYGADVMRVSACLLTIVARNEFRTCPWSGYDTFSCTKDTHFHLGIFTDTEDRVQLQVVSAPSLFGLWLVSIQTSCAVLSSQLPHLMIHESWSPRKRREVSGSSSSFVLRWLQLVLPHLTSMENSPAAQVSSCTWWSLQPDCTSAVPPVPASGVLEKESWPTSLAAVSPWGSF